RAAYASTLPISFAWLPADNSAAEALAGNKAIAATPAKMLERIITPVSLCARHFVLQLLAIGVVIALNLCAIGAGVTEPRRVVRIARLVNLMQIELAGMGRQPDVGRHLLQIGDGIGE